MQKHRAGRPKNTKKFVAIGTHITQEQADWLAIRRKDKSIGEIVREMFREAMVKEASQDYKP